MKWSLEKLQLLVGEGVNMSLVKRNKNMQLHTPLSLLRVFNALEKQGKNQEVAIDAGE